MFTALLRGWTVSFVNKALLDMLSFDFLTSEDEFRSISKEWSDIQIRKRGYDLMPGAFLAGDELVVQIVSPTVEDRAGLDLGAYRNRRGYFGLIVQDFCNAYDVLI